MSTDPLTKVLPGALRTAEKAISLLPRRIAPPLWREASAGALLLNMLRDELRDEPPRPTGGEPVLLIPGLFAGDASLAPLADTLREHGWNACPSGIRVNVDCSGTILDQLVKRLEEIAAEHGGPVALVGHSRGGLLARALAHRRPHLVSGVVTLGSPHRDQFALHPLLWAQIIGMLTLGTLGVPGLMRFSCRTKEPCCRDYDDQVEASLPAGVGSVSLFSRRDGVVDWRACVDPQATNVEVGATHCGMPGDPATLRAIVSALASFAASPEIDPAAAPLAVAA